MDRSTVLNFNVGVLGHIDSGKTSLGESVLNVGVLEPLRVSAEWEILASKPASKF